MYYPAAVKSVNLSAPSLWRDEAEGLSARCATSQRTAKKVSRGLGQHCATCSVAVDRAGGREDGGEEVKPKGPMLEMMQGLRPSRGTVHMEVVSSGKGWICYLFTFLNAQIYQENIFSFLWHTYWMMSGIGTMHTLDKWRNKCTNSFQKGTTYF